MEAAPEAIAISLPPVPDGWQIASIAVLADGTLAILGVDIDLQAEWARDDTGRRLGDPRKAAATAKAKLWTFDGVSLAEGPVFPLLTPFPMVDRFGDGRWLVASGRTWDGLGARILSPAGEELNHLHLGDGIMRLQIDAANRVWVGWFDEGVFGNLEWRVPGHEWPPSNYGLAAFDEHGAIAAHAKASIPEFMIADCYALNVVGETAVASTYPEFPVILMSPDEDKWFSTDLSGSRALAIKLPFVLAVGGYSDEGNRAVLLKLEGDHGRAIKEWRLPFQVGYPQRVDLIDGRGSAIHVIQDRVWYCWEIESFLRNTATGVPVPPLRDML